MAQQCWPAVYPSVYPSSPLAGSNSFSAPHIKSPQATHRQIATNKCYCCLWWLNNCTSAQDQRRCEWKVTKHCVSVCFCVYVCECSATILVHVWKTVCIWDSLPLLLFITIYRAATWGDLSFAYRHHSYCTDVCVCVCVCAWERQRERAKERERQRERIPIAHTIHHEARLTVMVMVASWRTLGSDTHTCTAHTLGLTRQITNWPWSYTSVNYGEPGTFRVNLKSAPGVYMKQKRCKHTRRSTFTCA